MKRILFITVGTGDFSKKFIDSLGHGLLHSIEETNPDFTAFFCSKESVVTFDSFKKQYQEKYKREYEKNQCSLIILNDIDDFNECYSKFKGELHKFNNDKVLIDYTQGTKTMTMTAGLCAAIYKKNLYFISGKRGDDGIVIKNTEEKKTSKSLSDL